MGFKKSFKGIGSSLWGGDNLLDRMAGGENIDESASPIAPEPGTAEPEAKDETEGELAVDVYETDSDITIKAMIAGVDPDDLDVEINREMVTIRGKRYDECEVRREDHYYQELYWGAFSRTIALPEEIDVEESQARHKNGLLTIVLPKIDKKKTQRLKVKEA